MDHPLWQPSAQQVEDSNLTRFRRAVNERWGAGLGDYAALYHWSVERPDRFWRSLWDFAEVIAGVTPIDYKTELQELAQAHHKTTPRYRPVGPSGPDHQRVFTVEVSIAGEVCGQGVGRSKKEAEQAAARMAHAKLLAREARPDLDRPPGE